MRVWPEHGVDLLLEEYANTGPRPGASKHSEQRLLAWAHALLSHGQFTEAADLLRPHAPAHPSVARLLVRALLRRGDRAEAERLVATLELPDLAQIESQSLEDERNAFFQAILDTFMQDPIPDDASA
jgi:hypothetical protein